jgi:chaperonin GroEL (HSP60 family)
MNTKSNLYDDIMASCNIISGEEFKDIITTIAQLASDTVVKTLGPYGSTTLVSDGTGFTYPSKDGWSTLNKLRFNDPEYNTLYGLIKQISFNSVNTVGDGTTSAMVAANYFLQIMNTFIDEGPGFRQADFINAVEEAANNISDKLLKSENIRKINDEKDIYKIAYIATNGNDKFSSIISNIYKETENPNIYVTLDSSDEVTYEIQTGYKFNASTVNFDIYINDENRVYKKDTLVNCVIFDHNVTYNEHKDIIAGLSSLAYKNNVEIIIMAPYFDDIIVSIINNSAQQALQKNSVPNLMLVQVPVSMEAHRKTLSDLAVLTNTQVFEHGLVRAFNILLHNSTHEKDEWIENDVTELEAYKNYIYPQQILESCIGSIRSIVIEKHHAFIKDYDKVANMDLLNKLIREAVDNYETLKIKANKTLNGHLDKDFMEAHLRYVKLLGKTGVIRVGGLSDIQRRCDKDSIDDAVLACRSAYDNGYIRGLNLEIISIIDTLYKEALVKDPTNESYNTKALMILYNAFLKLTYSVLRNKYPDDNTSRRVAILNNDPDSDNAVAYMNNTQIIDYCLKNNTGYDLVKEQISDIDNTTVINSVSTDLEILKAVVNILSTIMTSNQFISTTKAFDKKQNHDQALNRLIEDKKATTKAITQTIIDTIKEDEEAIELLLNIGNNLPMFYDEMMEQFTDSDIDDNIEFGEQISIDDLESLE